MKKIISALLVSTILINTTACGTILYPERKGQIKGQIDPAIAILDGVGLFFFIVPGVIAYAVDFSNGTIYLPGGGKRRHSGFFGELNTKDMEAVKVGQNKLSEENIKTIVFEHTGKVVDVHDPAVKVYKVNG